MKEVLVNNFQALAAIPRPTFHEEAVGRYLCERAAARGLSVRRDAVGNVIVDRPAAPGLEELPRVILQSHMDMVAVAREGSGWNGEKDAVTVLRQGDTLRAADSSLGADDGAGIAVILALLEDESLRCGPLRAIFTVDEEQTMSGARGLDPAELDGKYLLNLDWEEGGVLCCSSAGSDLIRCTLPCKRSSAAGRVYTLAVGGLLGGHSGMDIHKGRANAIRVLGAMLFELLEGGEPLRIASMEGGVASNAIPARAEAVVCVAEEAGGEFPEKLRDAFARQKAAYAGVDGGMTLTVTESAGPCEALGQEESLSLCRYLKTAPIGVFGVTPVDESVVESSANLSEVHFTPNAILIDVLQRSCVKSFLSKMRTEYAYRALRAGGRTENRETHALWAGQGDGGLYDSFRRLYREQTGRELKVTAVHAGLECGVWAQKNPALEMASLGMEVRNIHTPEETLDLESLLLLYNMVRAFLKEMAGA